jgi:hypothetical protein
MFISICQLGTCPWFPTSALGEGVVAICLIILRTWLQDGQRLSERLAGFVVSNLDLA